MLACAPVLGSITQAASWRSPSACGYRGRSVGGAGTCRHVGNSFLKALNAIGVGYNDPVSTIALGQSICPMLVEPPAGGFGAVAASMVQHYGMCPYAAGVFTTIAVSIAPRSSPSFCSDRRHAWTAAAPPA